MTRANILRPLPSLLLPFFFPPKGKEKNEAKGGKEGRGARLICQTLSSQARAPPLLTSLSLVYLFPLGWGKEREGKGRERMEDVGACMTRRSPLFPPVGDVGRKKHFCCCWRLVCQCRNINKHTRTHCERGVTTCQHRLERVWQMRRAPRCNRGVTTWYAGLFNTFFLSVALNAKVWNLSTYRNILFFWRMLLAARIVGRAKRMLSSTVDRSEIIAWQ